MNRLAVILVCSTLVAGTLPAGAAESKNLEMVIPRFELTEGARGMGGASMFDAVERLRELTRIPVSLEEVEYDMEGDKLTLAEALRRLHTLQRRGEVGGADQLRLQRYEAMARSVQNPETVIVGVRARTFKVSETDVTLESLLTRLTQLDTDYAWRNEGDPKAPVIVVYPKGRSRLDWSIEPICGGDQSLAHLYSPEGRLTQLFARHNISLVWFGGARLPSRSLDLCRAGLTAHEVLKLTVQAAGAFYWILGGVKGGRLLTFGSVAP
jgi:hypothetical protein